VSKIIIGKLAMTKYRARVEANYKAKLPIYLFYCCIYKTEPTYDNFIKYELGDKIIKKYATDYCQAERTELINNIPINKIYEFIKKMERR